jgi:catechol 2,3-dioxygenase-like lactoylglutathione lyase family enzyme
MKAALHHVSVFVADMDRAVRLFRDVLGFELQWRVSKAGGRLLSTLLGVPGIQVELAYLASEEGGTAVELSRLIQPPRSGDPVPFGALGTVALTLRVRGLDRLHRSLSDGGWGPLSSCLDLEPPRGNPVRAFCVPVEPGVLLELIEEQDGAPPVPA